MLDIYLADRPVTDDNLAQIGRHLAAAAERIKKVSKPLFLNLLRGCEIPADIYRSIMPELEIVDIPLSVDEVLHDVAMQILAEFLPAEKFHAREIFWIDEALGLGMGQAVLKLLYKYFGDGIESLNVVFLAAENGKYINPGFRRQVDETIEAGSGRITVEYANVDYIHWMDNNRILGMNWGRRYTLPRFWAPVEVTADLRNRLDSYRAGPIKKVKVGTSEFGEYTARIEGFLETVRPELEPHGYRFENRKILLPDGSEHEIPLLDNHVNDPHALWCGKRDEYLPAYNFLVSDPKLMIDFSSSDAAEYRERLLRAVEKNI
ncbi:MAG: hypothetical protein ACYS8W_01905 [Planctomycetota bacterium]|jgi:hypothetical protein